MDHDKDATRHTNGADDDFGCGWSVTTMLCGLYAQSAPLDADELAELQQEHPNAQPLIYRVA